MKPDAELLAQLDLLKQQFASGLPQRLDRIDAALDACTSDMGNPTPYAALVTGLHSLAGAAGIFGFGELGEQARTAEQSATQWRDTGCSREQLESLRALILSWRQVA